MSMKNLLINWKKLSLNMFLTYQILFVFTVIWDFFVTVAVPNTVRAHIFSSLPLITSVAIIVPWLLWIFIIAGIICLCIMKDDCNVIYERSVLKYGSIAVLYSIMLVLSIISPLVIWPVLVSYSINIIWALTLVYFGINIQGRQKLENSSKIDE